MRRLPFHQKSPFCLPKNPWIANNQINTTITGLIPFDLFRIFNIGDNQHIRGTIPAEFGSMYLDELALQGNSFSGSIPKELSQLSNLTHLAIGSNYLTGRLYSELGLLTRLTNLQVRLYRP